MDAFCNAINWMLIILYVHMINNFNLKMDKFLLDSLLIRGCVHLDAYLQDTSSNNKDEDK